MSSLLNVAKNTIVANVYKDQVLKVLVVIEKEKTGNLTKCYDLFGDNKEVFYALYKDSFRVATKKDIEFMLSDLIYWNKFDSLREELNNKLKGF